MEEMMTARAGAVTYETIRDEARSTIPAVALYFAG
jgi:hypothetical protein